MPENQRPNRQSIRMQSWDYTADSAYFVTLVTHERRCLFGEIVDGAMRVNPYGKIVVDEWQRSAEIRNEITLNEWVVIPNHLHGIVWIHSVNDEIARARSCAPLPMETSGHRIQIVPKSLGAFMNGFKGSVTTRISTLRNTRGNPIWQRNYYERVIRNERELSATQDYIQINITHWAEDGEHLAQPT